MCVLVEMVSRSYARGEVILKHQICSEETVRFDQGTFLGVYNRNANSHDSSWISLTILKLFSRPHDKTPNLTFFLETDHFEMKCYLVE